MACKNMTLKAVWQWKSNSDPWSNSEKEEWTNFLPVENDIIEDAYRNKEEQTEVDLYYIDFKQSIQISKSDKTKQRPIRRLEFDSKEPILRQRFFMSQKPVESFSNEFNHFCVVTAEWLYRNKDRLNVGYAVWVKEAADGIIREGNQLDPPRAVTAAHLAERLIAVKDQSLSEIVKCCIYLYTMETFLCYEVNKALRNGDLSKVDTYGAYCYFLSLMNDPGLLESPCHMKTVYRAMKLSMDDIELYKSSVGTYKAWAAFSSTSKKQSEAETFGPVLFIIRFTGHSRYGCGIDISSLSQYPYEEEILLQPGTNFRVDNMEYDDNTGKYRFYITVV